jgi:hypothetical protein
MYKKTTPWYLCALCRGCHRPIQLMEVQRESPLDQAERPAMQRITCPHCGKAQVYWLRNAVRIRAAVDAAPIVNADTDD